jgi:hypothetical protein
VSSEEIRWAAGFVVTIVIAVATIAIGGFRAFANRLDAAVSKLTGADDVLHERINRVRQDVSDNYVRRADLESHMKRVDETLKEVRDDQKAIIRQLAALEARQRQS